MRVTSSLGSVGASRHRLFFPQARISLKGSPVIDPSLELFGFSATRYTGFYALAANLLIVFGGSALARLLGARQPYGMLTEEEQEEPERA